MGASQSTSGKAPTQGLHVLRVTPSSPASTTDLEPFFDFIVGYERDVISHAYVNIQPHEFEGVVENFEDKRLTLIVWSSKTRSIRQVQITPSRTWALPPITPTPEDKQHRPSLLGLSMRVCEPELALDHVWHVLDVLEESPAESAGLVPYGDWIVGWSGGALGAENDFYDLVEAHEDKPLRVYVYSYDFDTLREVVLVPNRHWGGEGLLGCVFGYGLLHRIPTIQEDTREEDEENTFIPADSTGFAELDHDSQSVAAHNTQDGIRYSSDRYDTQYRSLAHPVLDNATHYLDPPYLPNDPASNGPSRESLRSVRPQTNGNS